VYETIEEKVFDGFVVLTMDEVSDFVAMAVGGDVAATGGLLEVLYDEVVVVEPFGIGRLRLVV
jgi:hypothetical protein